jgi:hypothetical protein
LVKEVNKGNDLFIKLSNRKRWQEAIKRNEGR